MASGDLIPVSSGNITDIKNRKWKPIVQEDIRLVFKTAPNASSSDYTVGIQVDGDFAYVCRSTAIHKVDITTGITVATISNPSARVITAFHADATHLYTAHSLDGIRKFDKATMTLSTASTGALSTSHYAYHMVGDSTHLYIATGTTGTATWVRKVAKSNIAASVADTTQISTPNTTSFVVLAINSSSVFLTGGANAGNTDLAPIWKITKSTMAMTSSSMNGAGNYGEGLWADENYVYRTGSNVTSFTRTPVSFATGFEVLTTKVPFSNPRTITGHNGLIYVGGTDSTNTSIVQMCALDPAANFEIVVKSTTEPTGNTSFNNTNSFLANDSGIFVGGYMSQSYLNYFKRYGRLIGYEEVL